MALLTNINGKFSVSDAGAVTFNNAFTFPTTDGTANYVLKTNGAGVLDWAPDANTDAVTKIIGGTNITVSPATGIGDVTVNADLAGTVTGSGTLNKVPRWTATGSNLGDGPITFSGSAATANSTFGGNVSCSNLTASVRLFSGDGGNKTNPMIANGSDEDTGIFFPAANTMAFTAGDTEAFRIAGANATFAGDVTTDGIYKITTAPDGNILELDQGGRSMDIGVYFSSNSTDSEWQFKTSTGNVNGSTTNALVVKPLLATFAGNVTVGANTVQNGATPGLKIQSTNTSQTVLGLHNTTTRNWEVAVGGSASGIGAGLFYIYDNTANDARLVIDTSGNVGIGTTGPNSKLQVVGKATSTSTVSTDAATTLVTKDYVDSSAGNPSHFRQGHKSHNLTNAFTTCLTVSLSNHTSCYVTVCCFGDWGSHSAAAYRGEFFLQNGANSYNEPGIILRQDDNTSNSGDQIVCQILDPTSTANPKNFEIQIRTTATTGTTGFTGLLTFTVQGQFNSVT